MIKPKAELKSLKDELKRRGVGSARATPVPPQPRAKIERLEKKHRFTLPAPLRDYYLQTNGHHVLWSLPEADVVGSSVVYDVDAFFSNKTSIFYEGGVKRGVHYYSKYLDEGQRKTLEEFFVFEKTYVDTFVLVSKGGGEAGSLHLLEYPFKLTELTLSAEEYLRELFANSALLNWQQQYKKADADAGLLKKFRADLKALRSPEGGGARPRKSQAGAYRGRLDELLRSLKSNKQVGPVRLETYPLAPLNVFRKIEKTFASELPEALTRFYGELNGFKLVWQSAPGGGAAGSGIIDLPPLELAFGGEHYRQATDWDDYVTYGLLWDDELRKDFPAAYDAVKGKRVFDRHTTRSQILMEPAGGDVSLFYYVDRGVTKLEVGFGELLETVFGAAGAEYYPELLLKRGKGADNKFIAGLLERIKLVNPDFRR